MTGERRPSNHFRAGRAAIVLLVLAAVVGLPVRAAAQADLSGLWLTKQHEDQPERGPGPSIGEYEGIPITDALRYRAQSWSSSSWNQLERMCIPHPSDYRKNFSHFELQKVVDPATFEVIAYKDIHAWMNEFGANTRTIWMDGRPHPPESALHTWEGFSTGVWNGDVLTVTTTHLKTGYLRRNGIARSDKGKLTEQFIRHDNYMTVVSIVEDPTYLTEPFVRSRDFILDPGHQITSFPCSVDVEIPKPDGWVPHWVPGTNMSLYEYADQNHLPHIAVEGGAETMYPEFMLKLKSPAQAAGR